MSTETMTILGAILTVLLSVNAFYFKDIVKTLTEIKVTLAKLSTEAHANQILLDKHDRELDQLRDKMHRLEGTYPTLLKSLNITTDDPS